jgi:hypothetical protein
MDAEKRSRPSQQWPQFFQSCEIDFANPLRSWQLDFGMIEFGGELLFETRVLWD